MTESNVEHHSVSGSVVRITVPRSRETYSTALRLVRTHRMRSWKRLLLGMLSIVAVGTVVIGWLNSFSVAYALFFFVFVSLFGLVGGSAGGWLQWQWVRRQSQREWLSQEGDIVYALGPGAVSMSFADGGAELRWAAFKKAVLAESQLLLYCAPQMAWFVPLDGLTPGERQMVEEWVRAGVPSGLVKA